MKELKILYDKSTLLYCKNPIKNCLNEADKHCCNKIYNKDSWRNKIFMLLRSETVMIEYWRIFLSLSLLHLIVSSSLGSNDSTSDISEEYISVSSDEYVSVSSNEYVSVGSHEYVSVGSDYEYWSDDFDVNKNCVREKEMKEMKKEEPDRCYDVSQGSYVISL